MEQQGNRHKAMEQFYKFPLFQAIATRRSHRFGLGFEMFNGSLKYKSDKKPVPLTSEETALLCFVGAGSTGLAFGDMDTTRGCNVMMHWTSRSFPSPCNNHQTRLLFVNDSGVYLYQPREARKIVEIETLDELEKLVQEFDKDVVKIHDSRFDVARSLGWVNKATVNQPGQTLFIPVVQPAYELINMALSNYQYDHFDFIDDATGKSAGTDKWTSKMNMKLKVPLSMLERGVLTACSMEAGFISQNILLAAQAMGLGAFPLGGYNSLIAMGGTPMTRGLGFHFVTDKSGFPNPVGIDKIMEGYCPPYKSMDEAVDTVVKSKFAPGGLFTPEADPTPFRDQTSFAKGMDRIPDDVVQCSKDFCNYVYNKYGKFPGTVDTMTIPMWTAAHHIDLDFYDKFYQPEAISENQCRHMADWH